LPLNRFTNERPERKAVLCSLFNSPLNRSRSRFVILIRFFFFKKRYCRQFHVCPASTKVVNQLINEKPKTKNTMTAYGRQTNKPVYPDEQVNWIIGLTWETLQSDN
jgi:hypothetical protein